MSETAILTAAQAAYTAGLSVVPPKEDGSKRPIGPWEEYQRERASPDQMAAWFRGDDRCHGLGAVLGKVSGNLEMLEFEGQAVKSGVWAEFCALATLEGVGELIDRITDGYLEDTPSGGIHILMRVEGGDPLGNTKLANSADGDVLIETRGEGGYVILAPSNGSVHPDGGAWKRASGDFDQIATITVAERDLLYDLARRLDQQPAVTTMSTPSTTPSPSSDGSAPWELFALTSDHVLEAAGFEYESESPDHRSGGIARHYTRPGKDKRAGSSASVWGDGRCTIFSTSVDVPAEVTDRRRLSPWQLHVMLNHRGDFSAAAKAERKSQQPTGDAISTDSDDFTMHEIPELPEGLRPYQPGDLGGHVEPLGEAALIGPIGELVEAVSPHTEATIPAISIGVLTLSAARAGRDTGLRVAGVDHAANLLSVIVGPSATARKGTADRVTLDFMRLVDPEFVTSSVISGIESGPALIETIRDPEYGDDGELVRGVVDQRALILDSEFSRTLKVTTRRGENLSEIIRIGFDQGLPLVNRTRGHGTVKSSNHHLGILGSITPRELEAEFPTVGTENGFGNRFLWAWSDSDKLVLDHGDEGRYRALDQQLRKIASAIPRHPITGPLAFTQEARERWNTNTYPRLRSPDKSTAPELVPMLTRGSDHVARVALNYALLDGAEAVGLNHLLAGEAWQAYSQGTLSAVLGGTVRDADATRVLEALRSSVYPTDRTALHRLFGRNATAATIHTAVERLVAAGLAYQWQAPSTGGRPPSLVMATTRVRKA